MTMRRISGTGAFLVNPILVGGLAVALTGTGLFPTTANAQAMGRGQGAAATDTSDPGRAPGFPATLQQDYVPAAPNDLGIAAIFVDYLNSPNAQPSIKVNVGRGFQQITYLGFNDDGVWLMPYNVIPGANNKPITIRIGADGKAVITLRDGMPRGLRNPSSTYLVDGPGGSGNQTTVASNDRGGAGGSMAQQRRPARPGILNNPDYAETLSTVGRGDSTRGRPAAIDGTAAKVDSSGLLTFQGSDSKTRSYKVARISQGTPEPGKPLMGAYLYTAPDGKSGILFTLLGTPDGKISGMPLNGQALGMLKPKSSGQ